MVLGKWQDFDHAAERMEDGFKPLVNRLLTLRKTVPGVSANDERFFKAVWASGLADEIKPGRMSLGMQLEESGYNLSGGQRQKVVLARTFAQPCRILLLDESTLGTDPDGEKLLAERLPQLLDPNDVLIMTTHSAAMLTAAKQVIALDGGKVIADGDRGKLVRVN